MAATPEYCSFSFINLRTRQTETIDGYLSDVANALGTFDDGQGAGSGTSKEYNITDPMILTDFSVVTGTQDTTKIRLMKGNTNLTTILRYTPHLTTVPTRPKLSVRYDRGDKFKVMQMA